VIPAKSDLPSSSAPFAHTVVIGAGAVGGYFGAMLARAGQRVTLVARPAQAAAIARDGLRLDKGGRVEVIPMAATTDLAVAADADLVLVAVKSTDTAAVARQLAAHLRADAIVLSLQNGVENAATLAATVRARVVPAVVYVATAAPEPGLVRHFGRGDLRIGALTPAAARDPAVQAQLRAIVAHFAAAGVGVTIADDVIAELWEKLMVNCAYNAISALAQASYAQLAAQPQVRALQESIVREVVAVAAADGIGLDLDASLQAMARIAVAMPGQLSSTAQDVARRKPTEIDHLNGFVARRGRALGVPVPVNETLHALVRLIEAGYRASDDVGR
jgi:2-dehydropantoate 2-reductase